ncbi:MAG TPA: DUF1800 domain-containing protein [Holophagaceae bacterium]|jgi:uncharacterized protein (DUF1800 family)|nr:DUF1800 domain-containing protein [Holophagaceae bacterium]
MRIASLPVLLTAPLMAQVIPASPLPAQAKATHLLARLTFGPRPGEVEALTRGGDAALTAWLKAQLDPAPEPQLNTWIGKEFPTQAMSIGQLQAAFPRPAAVAKQQGLKRDDPAFKQEAKDLVPFEKRPARIDEEQAGQKLVRAIESRDQLQEVLADFWFNHFNVDESKGLDRWFVTGYERDAIRPHVFGRFRDMLGAVAWHPAMLFYLDNWLSVQDGFQAPRQGNRKAGLNENYGRELMELHTLGVDGGYTQADVAQVARCFTGWSIQDPQQDAAAIFRPRTHDDGPKTVMGVVITAGGREDGERVLDMLASSPTTARHLATLLCRRFIADDPPATAVNRVAKAYMSTNGDLRAVYDALFRSPEFWAKAAMGAKVKTPFEFVVSSVRALDGHVDDPLPISRTVARMGEPLYHCQPPTGYKDTADAWVSTGALVERLRFGVALAKRQVPGVVWPDLPPQASTDPSTVIDALSPRLAPAGLSPGTRGALLKAASAMPLVYPDGERRPVDQAQLLGFLLGSPEFQRR